MQEQDLTTTYCTPDDVAETMDLPDPHDTVGMMYFSDTSHPSYDRVCKIIRSNEDIIDRRLRKSWRENHVKNYVCDIDDYQWDQNGYRAAYYLQGGDSVQLRKNILKWDPRKGDKLEIRNRQNVWTDISYVQPEGMPPGPDEGNVAGEGWRVWFDYNQGKMYIRTRWFQQRYNGIRISYRYGANTTDPDAPDYEELPAAISRLCCLMTAIQVINMSAFYIKIGTGGDVTGIKNDLIYNWQQEADQIWSSFQRSGSVHSLYR